MRVFSVRVVRSVVRTVYGWCEFKSYTYMILYYIFFYNIIYIIKIYDSCFVIYLRVAVICRRDEIDRFLPYVFAVNWHEIVKITFRCSLMLV